MRNMSFSMTAEAMIAKTKTVTRRQGWAALSPGDVLCAVKKGMGLKKGEKVERLGKIRVVAVERLPISEIDQADCIAEGFGHLTPAEFVAMYCKANGCKPEDACTRIQFVHIDEEVV